MTEVVTSPESATNPAPRLVMSVEAAAEALSISRTRMFELLRNGAISSIRVGRLRRIPASALNDYVERLDSTRTTRGED